MQLSEAGGLIKTNNLKFICLDSVDSTNLEAERLIKAGCKQNAVIVANEQTAGRGRSGKSFYSPGNTGLYMSVVLHPNAPLESVVSVTTRVSVAVARAIERIACRETQIKWVNDILLDGRKVCGILVKALSDFSSGIANSLIIGVGVNVAAAEFPDEIKNSAGSLALPAEKRAELAAEIADGIFESCLDLTDRGYLSEYRKRSSVIGKRISYIRDARTYTAAVENIDDNGGLMIIKDNGESETLTSGEISVRLSEE